MTTEHRDAFYHRGYSLRGAGRPDLAAREFERAIEVDPRNARSYAMLALCRYDLGRHEQALVAARTAVSLDPADAFVLRAMGWALIGASRAAEARPHAIEALRLEPEVSYGFLLLAEIELLTARYAEALSASEQALTLDPQSTVAHRQRSVALRGLGRLDDSRAAAEAALALDPNDGNSHVILARIATAQRDVATAAKAWREALRLNPADEEARSGLLHAMKTKHLAYRWATGFHRWYFGLGVPARYTILIVVGIATSGIGAVVLMIVLAAGRSADPVANLVLRFDRYGRALLTPEQILAADHALKVVLAIGLAIATGVLGGSPFLIIDAALVGVFVPTVAEARNCTPGRPRRWMAAYLACVAGAIGVGDLLGRAGHIEWSVVAFGAGAVGLVAGEGVARRCGFPWSHRFDARSR